MYVCMYVCMHIVYTCVYYIYTHMCVYIYIYIYICTHASYTLHAYAYACTCVHACVRWGCETRGHRDVTMPYCTTIRYHRITLICHVILWYHSIYYIILEHEHTWYANVTREAIAMWLRDMSDGPGHAPGEQTASLRGNHLSNATCLTHVLFKSGE